MKSFGYYFLLCVALLRPHIAAHKERSRLGCRDNENHPVDWFIIYKLPVYYHSSFDKDWPFPPHLYMDSSDPQFKFVNVSLPTLNSTKQAAAYTLQQAYDNHKSNHVGYFFYNDEHPESAGGKRSSYLGHTKGVMTFDELSGFWLVHSVPKYPPPTNTSYSYPENAVYFGQHYLCVSLAGAQDIAGVGLQLDHNQPFVYDWNLPTQLESLYPIMAKVAHRKWSSETNHTVTINTPNGLSFTVFAKSAHFRADLYANLVAVSLQCNMKVETWQHSRPDNLNSSCHKYQVENVQQISSVPLNIHFGNHEDHSKFAICAQDWICIGDINRQYSQLKRGGGTVCFKNDVVHKQYEAIIEKVEECPN